MVRAYRYDTWKKLNAEDLNDLADRVLAKLQVKKAMLAQQVFGVPLLAYN